MKRIMILSILFVLFLLSCQTKTEQEEGMTFKSDLDFLKKHKEVIVLSDDGKNAQVAIVPAWQGRVMTSTANGDDGLSFGWINRKLIASGERKPHINVFGGEDRYWLGPEGGQFSIFFKEGDPFDLEHWYVPAPIDWEPFEVVSTTEDNAVFKKEMTLENYSNFVFDLEANREVRLMDQEKVIEKLGIDHLDDVNWVAFESINSIKNIGSMPWKKESGLLSIWILGMFKPSPYTTVVIPYKAGPVDELGPVVNDEYFGKVPKDRLIVKKDFIFFMGDGKYRSKIGVPPRRCKPVLGSYEEEKKVLTLIQFNKQEGVTDYVNSLWKIQDEPFGGDVVNSYNDGPAEPGAEPLGPFYELETSSPAADLDPGETLTHIHRTIHIVGEEKRLDEIAKVTLGVSLEEIVNAF